MNNIYKIISALPADVKIIPGHGPLSTLKELTELYSMMAITIGNVHAQIKQGQPLEKIVEGGVPGPYKDWGWQFISEERWLTIVHESITSKDLTRTQSR